MGPLGREFRQRGGTACRSSQEADYWAGANGARRNEVARTEDRGLQPTPPSTPSASRRGRGTAYAAQVPKVATCVVTTPLRLILRVSLVPAGALWIRSPRLDDVSVGLPLAPYSAAPPGPQGDTEAPHRLDDRIEGRPSTNADSLREGHSLVHVRPGDNAIAFLEHGGAPRVVEVAIER